MPIFIIGSLGIPLKTQFLEIFIRPQCIMGFTHVKKPEEII